MNEAFRRLLQLRSEIEKIRDLCRANATSPVEIPADSNPPKAIFASIADLLDDALKGNTISDLRVDREPKH